MNIAKSILIVTITSFLLNSCKNEKINISEIENYSSHSVRNYNTTIASNILQYSNNDIILKKIHDTYVSVCNQSDKLLYQQQDEEGYIDLFAENIVINNELKQEIDSLQYYIKTSFNSELLTDSIVKSYVNNTAFNKETCSYSYLDKQVLILDLCFSKIIRYYVFNLKKPSNQRYTIAFNTTPFKKEVHKNDSIPVYLQSFLPRHLFRPNITLVIDKDTFLMNTDTMLIKIPINKYAGKYKIECNAINNDIPHIFYTEYTVK